MATFGNTILDNQNCEIYFGNFSEWGTPSKKYSPYWVGCKLKFDIICVTPNTPGVPTLSLPNILATVTLPDSYFECEKDSFGRLTGKKIITGKIYNTSSGTSGLSLKQIFPNEQLEIFVGSRLEFDNLITNNSRFPVINSASYYNTLLSALEVFDTEKIQKTKSEIDCIDCPKPPTTTTSGTSGTGGTSGTRGLEDPCAGKIDPWNNKPEMSVEEYERLSLPGLYYWVTSSIQSSGYTETTSPIKVIIPDNPCYIGYKKDTTETIKTVYYYASEDPCFNTNYIDGIKYAHTITVKEDKYTTSYEQKEFNAANTEVSYEFAFTIQDPDDSCGCKEYNIVKVKLKCKDNPNVTIDSQIRYTDGIPENILKYVPLGHTINPEKRFNLRPDCVENDMRIYHPFNPRTDIVAGKVSSNTRGLFNLSQSMSCYATSSLQSSASKDYYYEVIDCDCKNTPYFAVAYGNINGSGSLNPLGVTNNDTPTRAIYSQYRLLALDEPDTKFKFYSSGVESESNDIYVINFYRTGLSDRIDPGNFEIALRPLSGSAFANNVHTGSNVQVSGSTVYTFIDNSDDRSDLATCSEDPYISYDIISGSLINGPHSSGIGDTKTTYGKFYPNLGVMVLHPSKLNSLLNFNTVTGSNIAGDNAMKLFTSISGSGVLNQHIKARNVKYKTTNHYFVRIPPQYTYSNNPTFYADVEEGLILNSCFEKDPITYPTSIGLYDTNHQLLAVAKLSRPIKKTLDDDLLIKIRLNW